MSTSLPLRRIFQTWWPLAASWLLMGIEVPALSAVIARLADPEVHLAAFGGVVHPLSLIVEAPIIMLLAASTALSKDWDSYQKLRRFMMVSGAALTGLHALVAFTPLYDVVVSGILSVPPEVVDPGRRSSDLMLPWTWSIAYRRFNQGVLIRFGHSRAVGVGTIVRLSADALVAGAGYLVGTMPGIVVASAAMAAGVFSEAAFAGIVVRPVLQGELRHAPPAAEPLTLRSFLEFYIPLAMTSLLTLITNPIGSAALSRMPQALASLAAWPVVSGLIFMLRSLGVAFNGVVVALLDEPRSVKNLRPFTFILAAATSFVLLLVAATPLAGLWFEKVSALSPELSSLARTAIWLGIPLPAISVVQSWFQGARLNDRRTRGITEAVVVFLIASGITLGLGIAWNQIPGLYFGITALVIASTAQSLWLWLRARRSLEAINARDAAVREVSAV